MQLTKQTDFAFRTLLYLAHQPADQLVHIQQLCDYYQISPNHLSKIVVKLGHLGYIHTVRGKGGGIALNKAALKAPLADIVRAFETTLDPVNCEASPCRLLPNCRLKHVLNDAMHAFMGVLGQYTLQDLLDNDIQVIRKPKRNKS
ncbi:MAG TPA: Rrf2 family transcriptional regulator [Pseudomonadales bacterium]|jgi:Rrf2 family nitric oxide-sensitive transcriptional repressor